MLDGLVKPLPGQIPDKQARRTIGAIKLHSHKIIRCVESRHGCAAGKGSGEVEVGDLGLRRLKGSADLNFWTFLTGTAVPLVRSFKMKGFIVAASDFLPERSLK